MFLLVIDTKSSIPLVLANIFLYKIELIRAPRPRCIKSFYEKQIIARALNAHFLPSLSITKEFVIDRCFETFINAQSWKNTIRRDILSSLGDRFSHPFNSGRIFL